MSKFEIPVPTVHLQPNPHRNHDFTGRSNTFEINTATHQHRTLNRAEEALNRYLGCGRPSIQAMREKPDALYIIDRIMCAGEIFAFQVYDINPGTINTLNVQLTAALNSQHYQYAQMVLARILPQSIVQPEY